MYILSIKDKLLWKDMKYRFKKLKEQSAFLLFEFLKIKFLRLPLLTFKQATLKLLHETQLRDEPKSFHLYKYIYF